VSAFAVTIYGKPQPAGSKRAFVNPRTKRAIVVDDAKGSRPWKQQVAGAALDACGGEPPLLEGPLVLTVTFYLQRPKGHYRTGRNAELLRAAAPPYPVVKPDTTKLLRAVEDALTGIAWRDDAQVVCQAASKHYGLPERCEIEVDRAPTPIGLAVAA
jgi:Holliday junction resolvase RusA-like endonuclease